MKLVLLILLFAVSSFAVSFDCSKALKKDEKMICNNQELSQLDSKISDLYSHVIDIVNPEIKKEIQSSQKNWLNNRNKCSDINCLKNIYNEQLLVLNTYNKSEVIEKENYSLLEYPQIYEVINKVDSFLKKYGIKLNYNITFIAILIILAIILIIFLVIIIKIKKFISLQKMRKGLEQEYKRNSELVGKFLSNDVYLNSHLKIIDPKLKNKNDIQIDVIKIFIPISKCLINANARWTADVGEIDDVAYQQALNNYNIAKARHDAENDRLQYAGSNNVRMAYQGQVPSRDKFIRYSYKNGQVDVNLNNSWIVLNEIKDIKSNIDNLNFSLNNKIENKIVNVYKDLFKLFIDLNISKDNIIIKEDKDFTIKKLENKIELEIKNKIINIIGSKYKNLDVTNLDRNLQFNDLLYLPLVIVISNKNGKNRITIHDHLDSNTIFD